MATWQDIVGEAARTPPSKQKVALLQEAVDAADAINEVEGAFDTRMLLIETTYYVGDPIAALAAFAWCVARRDEEPERFATILRDFMDTTEPAHLDPTAWREMLLGTAS